MVKDNCIDTELSFDFATEVQFRRTKGEDDVL